MGRLAPEKRVDWLLKSFKTMKRYSLGSKAIKLVISGGSSATDQYVSRLKQLSNNDPDILYTGYVTGVEKDELFANALIFGLPSYLEGFPIVLLEAKSHGVCCLASDISPHKEAIHSGVDGLLFRSDDLSDLTVKLVSLVEDREETEHMGRKAREEMEKRPSWNEIVAETVKVYEEIVGRAGGAVRDVVGSGGSDDGA